MESLQVGWIGLGNAGYPMAACLAKRGHRLLVRDADPARSVQFVEKYPKCRMATLDAESFKDCDVVVTMLPNGEVVRDVLFGDHGIAGHLKPGSVVIDTSSSSPFHTRDLGGELAKLSVDLVDSPITQERLHAIDDRGATLMVGSDSPDALQKVMPILKDMSTHVFPMGGLGTGHTMKTLNNYVSVGSIIALCDALVTGQKLGLDPQTMIDVLNVGTGVNFSTKYSMRNLKSFDTGYQLELLVKDVKIAKEVIEQSGFESELPGLALKYLEDSLKLVETGADHSECIKSWEQRAGVEIAKTERRGDETRLQRSGSVSQKEPVLYF
ncbi:2-hydroxy-3-oxopropionate reductase [Aaosphaeria arxii CBS 175.79]|uniref:3-hydroxyisobutyrate dehydrogenase n=1 Tax=Aaosphaeria arxii CBS 175.79 TaxID=1450172 RepID=A0A6A5XRZ0_9PLEO|nr:2-hydroxy-3-oxopropionate reductase [Aaosphaeria arxii CBS 175.79]KAF2015703.1 2-hydroxy-3-oxopropionate reductase [Aaosphaeria arxii CBS 175.79]